MNSRWFGICLRVGSRLALRTLGLAVIMAAVSGKALAFGPLDQAPEIDPGSMVSALALLCGGLLMLTDRWARKK
jgi:hypothetical protein